MKRLFSIIISIGVIGITIYSVFGILPTKKEIPLAINGEMDLSLWDFDNRNNIQLDGEWEFYPGEFIKPERDKDMFLSYRNIMKKVHVPGPWKDYVSEGQHSKGVGTYRLIVNLPADDIYGVKTNKINYANRLYLNGYPAGSSGIPSEDYNEYVGNIQMYVGVAPSHEREMEIVFHVANFNYPTGGIVNSVDFGTMNGIIYLRDISRAKDALLIGGYIVLSLIFFFLYVREKDNRFFLHFSMLCLSVCIHLSLLNERMMDLIIPNIGLDTLVNLQISFIHFAALFFLWFTHTLFKEISNRNIMIIISLIVGFQASLYAIPPLRALILWGMPMLYKQILIVSIPAVVCLYVSVILIRAFLQKRAETEYILVIITTFLCYGFLISADFLYNIPVGQVPIVLFTMMILFLALLMERRSELTNRYIKQLSKDLLIQDRIKDEFLAKTSVQLNEPLKNIKCITQSLMEGKGSTLKSDQHESVMLIYRVSQRLEYIVSDLLNASEIKKGDILITPKPTKLTMLRHVIEEMRHFVSNSKNVEIVYDIPSDSPLVFVDEQRLNQIMFNLLHNAVFYTNEGTVIVSATVVDEEVNIVISDTGIGISEEEIDSIFTSFYRGENALNYKSGGLGLGLTIVKQLVELSNGRIWVHSTVGVGSKFTFSIPLVTKDILQNDTQTMFLLNDIKSDGEIQDTLRYPYKSIGNRKYTILIVGNEYAEITELIEIIQSIEYSLIATDTGKSALEIMDNEMIDLLIVDSALSDISGDEICRIVRERYHMIELPILIFMTMGQLVSLDMLSKNNAEIFLKKPINAREVIEGVESLLAMKESSEKSLHDELSFFYAQITPHFLYNTLNTIIGLSYKSEEKTREALQHLTVYFRAKLNFYNRGEMILLGKELELVQSYVEIEKMRFGDRIHLYINVDDTIDINIPPLTLQPLVENAIEHGLLKREGGGILYLSVRRVKEGTEIIIEDNGVGMKEEQRIKLLKGKTNGIGFTNAIKRLKLIRNLSFNLESEEEKGTKITIILPKEKRHESHNS